MTPSRSPYSEGDVFGVPLNGGWALGVVARVAPEGRLLLGYFFGPKRAELPDEVPELRPEDAVSVQRFGDLGLIEGSWPVLGAHPGWRRQEWPMPAFRRTDDVSGAVFRIDYDDDDPGEMLERRRVDPAEVEGLSPDGLAGAGAVIRRLARLLR
jgi:Immunity protein 26